MSIHIHEDRPERAPMRQSWAGVVATSPTDFSDEIWVRIPDLDPDIRVGPCRWQARNNIDLPSRGDDCLVIFDNNNQPWVTAWWPFS